MKNGIQLMNNDDDFEILMINDNLNNESINNHGMVENKDKGICSNR